MPDLPAVIEEMRLATNAGDFDRFIACFADDAVVDDWGSRYEGRAAIKAWSDREMTGAHGTLTVTRLVSSAGGVTAFDTDWKSSFYSGASRFTVTLRDGRIAGMRISQD